MKKKTQTTMFPSIFEQLPENIIKEFVYFKKTNIPRCSSCLKDMVIVKEDSGKTHKTWKFDCDCQKESLRLSIG